MKNYRNISWFVPLHLFIRVSSFQMRLSNGDTSYMGRVEVNFDDGHGWGTVCDDNWDVDDASVVCRGLHLEYQIAIPLGRGRFGEGTGPINMDDVACTGSESSLRYCPYVNRTREDCSHTEDAGVICWFTSVGSSFTAYIENTDSMIQYPLDGRLMLRNTGSEKFSVCSNNFGTEEARVACNELGHDRNRSVTFDVHGIATEEHCNRIEFNCTGTEYRLSYCRRVLKSGSCPSNSPVAPGIACNYEKVSKVTIYGTTIKGDKLMLNIGDIVDIHCETGYARPRPQLRWYLDYVTVDFGVQNSIITSNALYKVRSTLTMIPKEKHHGMTLFCCSEDPTGYRVCSTHYTIYIRVFPNIDTLEISYRINKTSSDMNLICLSTKTRPEAELRWYRNGELVNDSDVFSVKNEVSPLSDSTFYSRAVLTVKGGKAIGGDGSLQCEATVDEYRQMLHIPVLFFSDGKVSSNLDDTSFPIGVIVAFAVLGLGILLLSVATVCLIHRIRKQEHSASSTQPYTIGECFDNRTYRVDREEVSVPLENYERLQLPQNENTITIHPFATEQPPRLPKRRDKNKNKELYENTREQSRNRRTTNTRSK